MGDSQGRGRASGEASVPMRVSRPSPSIFSKPRRGTGEGSGERAFRRATPNRGRGRKRRRSGCASFAMVFRGGRWASNRRPLPRPLPPKDGGARSPRRSKRRIRGDAHDRPHRTPRGPGPPRGWDPCRSSRPGGGRCRLPCRGPARRVRLRGKAADRPRRRIPDRGSQGRNPDRSRKRGGR